MQQLQTLLFVVLAMLAPYGVAAALSAALPRWRRIGDFPSTGQMVVKFFDGTGPDRMQLPVEGGAPGEPSTGW